MADRGVERLSPSLFCHALGSKWTNISISMACHANCAAVGRGRSLGGLTSPRRDKAQTGGNHQSKLSNRVFHVLDHLHQLRDVCAVRSELTHHPEYNDSAVRQANCQWLSFFNDWT